MTIDEANSKVKELSKLNLCIWDASTSSEKEELRNKFREIYKDVQEAGFKVIRGKEYDPVRGYRIPKFKIHNDHSEELVNIIDNRGEGNHHGDCTTRCISFCTGVDYETIQKEQMRNANEAKARGCYVTWRTCRVWSQSLTSRGFTELFLPKHVSAKVFISKFKDSGIDDGIIAARSSGHVAAIDMKTKKILDTWNSAGKRIKSIFVPISQKCMWMDKLEKILNK